MPIGGGGAGPAPPKPPGGGGMPGGGGAPRALAFNSIRASTGSSSSRSMRSVKSRSLILRGREKSFLIFSHCSSPSFVGASFFSFGRHFLLQRRESESLLFLLRLLLLWLLRRG